jgi:peroxiredoxin
MRYSRVLLSCLITALLVLAGCGDSQTDNKTDEKSLIGGSSKTNPSGKTNDDGKTQVAIPAKPKPEITKVDLSAEEEATCLVKQNGPFPDAKLKDLTGADKALSQLRGEQATVLLLWSSQNRASRGTLRTLSAKAKQEDNVPGLKYVGICVGDDAADAKQTAEDEGTPFPVLLDTDLGLFNQVVKVPSGSEVPDVLPRVYLLDSGGKVLWMSLAFQVAAERELQLALDFVLHRDTAKDGE